VEWGLVSGWQCVWCLGHGIRWDAEFQVGLKTVGRLLSSEILSYEIVSVVD
jgi:hypothetical protein